MPKEPNYSLAFRFPDQSPAFAHGFDCGRIWEQMRGRGVAAICHTTVSENRETIEAMAMSLGWVEEITDLADGWIQVNLSKPEGDAGSEPPITPELRKV